jgi:hypothetical protein
MLINTFFNLMAYYMIFLKKQIKLIKILNSMVYLPIKLNKFFLNLLLNKLIFMTKDHKSQSNLL